MMYQTGKAIYCITIHMFSKLWYDAWTLLIVRMFPKFKWLDVIWTDRRLSIWDLTDHIAYLSQWGQKQCVQCFNAQWYWVPRTQPEMPWRFPIAQWSQPGLFSELLTSCNQRERVWETSPRTQMSQWLSSRDPGYRWMKFNHLFMWEWPGMRFFSVKGN